MKPAMTPQQASLVDSKKSALSMYRNYAIGDESWLSFLYYEFCLFSFSSLPGLPGFGTRSIFYPRLFGACGKRPAFGRGMVIRRPAQIEIGSRCMFDDYSVLDVREDGAAMRFGDYVSVGRFSTVAAKGGEVVLGNGVNIGTYCRLATQSRLELGESVLIAAYTYIGPGNHRAGDGHTPLISREMEIKGGVNIGAHVWLGSHVTVADGVTIGDGSIIGAHSFVRDDIPAGVIAAGCPAKVLRTVEQN